MQEAAVLRRAKAYFVSNGSIVLVGTCSLWLIGLYNDSGFSLHLLLAVYLASVLRVAFFLGLIWLCTRHKTHINDINSKHRPKCSDLPLLWFRAIVVGGFFEMLIVFASYNLVHFAEDSSDDSFLSKEHRNEMNTVANNTTSTTQFNNTWLCSALMFIPHSFLFEVVFDFFHYWSHRLCHEIPFLYKNVHSTHHKYLHPTVLTTYQQHPLDEILTNFAPVLLALSLVPRFTEWQFHILMAYKTFVEIAGHSGVHSTSTSFPQFNFFPKLFGIELYTYLHDLHHTRINRNYSKRFVLWDKIFGTFGDNKKIN